MNLIGHHFVPLESGHLAYRPTWEFQDLQFELHLDPEWWSMLSQAAERVRFSVNEFFALSIVPHLKIKNLPRIGKTWKIRWCFFSVC